MDSELHKEDSSQSGFVSVAREILVRFINQHFPTRIISVRNVFCLLVENQCFCVIVSACLILINKHFPVDYSFCNIFVSW